MSVEQVWAHLVVVDNIPLALPASAEVALHLVETMPVGAPVAAAVAAT